MMFRSSQNRPPSEKKGYFQVTEPSLEQNCLNTKFGIQLKCIVLWNLLSLSFLQNLKKGFELREIPKSYKWKVTLKGFKLPEIPKSYKWKVTLDDVKAKKLSLKTTFVKTIVDEVTEQNVF